MTGRLFEQWQQLRVLGLSSSRPSLVVPCVNFFSWMGARAQVVQAQHTAMPYAPKKKQ